MANKVSEQRPVPSTIGNDIGKTLLAAHHLVPVNFVAAVLKLTTQGLVPTVVVHRRPHYASKVAGNLNLATLQCTHSFAPQVAEEIAKFQQDVFLLKCFDGYRFFSNSQASAQEYAPSKGLCSKTIR